jgi:hypothetical protein
MPGHTTAHLELPTRTVRNGATGKVGTTDGQKEVAQRWYTACFEAGQVMLARTRVAIQWLD